ncbi:sulfotransferase family 2 domain-containing protein [Oceanimonas marisflavi]|uniref:sulfotransferase family 2 domain-containing protein n=1 Tax=Oceanimonas marisflavi TaxID=2059724 RepID=UPI000D303467|nr:sulfotransferase family 2 domain-containing protein [Oceanimonas marisflavi]
MNNKEYSLGGLVSLATINYSKRPKALLKAMLPQKRERYSYFDINRTGVFFLHIPKCAGVSINKALYGSLGVGHVTLEDALVSLGPIKFNNFFKFTIVRNPWDRLVSSYFFLKQGGFCEKDKFFFKKNLACFDSFKDFVVNWVNEDNILTWNHFIPQSHFLSSDKKQLGLDYICFFENLDSDLNYLSSVVGISSLSSVKPTNKAVRDCYLDYYDKETIEIVERVYKADIELLGYDYRGDMLSKQIESRNHRFEVCGYE